MIRVRISEIHHTLVKEEEVINPLVLKQHFLGTAKGPNMPTCNRFEPNFPNAPFAHDRNLYHKET